MMGKTRLSVSLSGLYQLFIFTSCVLLLLADIARAGNCEQVLRWAATQADGASQFRLAYLQVTDVTVPGDAFKLAPVLGPRTLFVKQGSQKSTINSGFELATFLRSAYPPHALNALRHLATRQVMVDAEHRPNSKREDAEIQDKLTDMLLHSMRLESSQTPTEVTLRLDLLKTFGTHEMELLLYPDGYGRFLLVTVKLASKNGETEVRFDTQLERWSGELSAEAATPTTRALVPYEGDKKPEIRLSQHERNLLAEGYFNLEQRFRSTGHDGLYLNWFSDAIIPFLKGYPHGELRMEDIYLKTTEKGVKISSVQMINQKKPNDLVESTLQNPLGLTGERADVFALGVVLYRIMSGRSPFTAAHLEALAARDVLDLPEAQRFKLLPHIKRANEHNSAFKPELGEIVEKSLRDPEYTLTDMQQDITHFLTQWRG